MRLRADPCDVAGLVDIEVKDQVEFHSAEPSRCERCKVSQGFANMFHQPSDNAEYLAHFVSG